jgi:hypothetical protein
MNSRRPAVPIRASMSRRSRLVEMRVAAMLDGDRDVEAVRLGDLIDGFPVGSVIGEQKDLTCAAWA